MRKTNSTRKARTNTKKLLRAAVGVPSVKDMLERQQHNQNITQETKNDDNTDTEVNNDSNNVNSEVKTSHSESEITPQLPEGARISLKLSGVKYK